MVIRTPRGFGQVIFVAADLDQAPAEPLERPYNGPVAKLLDLPGDKRATTTTRPSAEASTASTTWPANSAVPLDPFYRRSPGACFVVALLIIGYILLIGPGDYFLLPRASWAAWNGPG